ncbi:hypothetical protein TrCOL_g11363 [Triparma columacea]|uniref:MYND-type domain-containing protein n=1 Tax=Triparma columacea TaxID=722753 RepID=A0A9W7GFB8_9STRA|nr:hypothetical protein TrCOL_g11363 [Triparma columacea]
MESQSEDESSHNSSETTNATVQGWDDLTEGQLLCLQWADEHDWDRVKGYVKEHGPEVLLGVRSPGKNTVVSVLSIASLGGNVEMVKLTLDAGFDNKKAMYAAASTSMRNSDNSTILILLLEHGLDPNMDLQVEGLVEVHSVYNSLLMIAGSMGHIDQAIALLDHGANVNKTMVDPYGDVVSPLNVAMSYGAHDICRLFLTRGAIPTTNDVKIYFFHCLYACKGEHPRLSRDVAIKMFTTFLHLGKPDSDVVRDQFNLAHPSRRDPTITNITKHYLQGRPFCCFICEALTAKERDKLLMCPCRTVAYCSKDCQVKHWKKHRVLCTGPLNERGESEAMVKKRSKTGKGTKGGGADGGVAEGAGATGKNGKKGKKGKNSRGKKK